MKYFLIFVFLVVSFLPSNADNQFAVLSEEFDARYLSEQEKRILQTALAVKGLYGGLLDGKWGGKSQLALEKYTSATFAAEPVNIHITSLLYEYLDEIEYSGWQLRRFPDAGLSLLLPMKQLELHEIKEDFKSWKHLSKNLLVRV